MGSHPFLTHFRVSRFSERNITQEFTSCVCLLHSVFMNQLSNTSLNTQIPGHHIPPHQCNCHLYMDDLVFILWLTSKQNCSSMMRTCRHFTNCKTKLDPTGSLSPASPHFSPPFFILFLALPSISNSNIKMSSSLFPNSSHSSLIQMTNVCTSPYFIIFECKS